MGLTQYIALIGNGETGWAWQFFAGGWLTIQISVCGYLIGLILGLIGAWGKLSGNRVTFVIAEAYTTIVRAVPELLLIILLYYTGTSTLRDYWSVLALVRTSR
jgi:His/Glu/Gln/Arg/opine family amino acid ABC transporter permease subunit